MNYTNLKNYYNQHYKKIVGILLLSVFLVDGIIFFLHPIESAARTNLREQLIKESYPNSIIEEKCGYYSFSFPNILAYTMVLGIVLWGICNILITFILIFSKKHIGFRIVVLCFWVPYFAIHIYAALYAYLAVYD